MDLITLLTPPKVTRALITSPSSLFSAAISLRIVLLFYGLYQDAHAPLKYTDIDYYVFTDAARYMSYGYSPYLRDTYRYTPLLAWTLLPTTWEPQHIWSSFGKALFAISDIVAGWMIFVVLQKRGLNQRRALKYSSIWLLNPMVATISTRGSSEGLLCVMVMGLLWATEMRHIALAGILLGLSVHFKIYPFIYGVSILWSLGTSTPPGSNPTDKVENRSSIFHHFSAFLNLDRMVLIFTSLATFSLLNIGMYSFYGMAFMQHTYLHHLTRIDHRHNFSPYNTLLYLSSAKPPETGTSSGLHFESLAFIPQLVLSAILIPMALSKSSLPRAMLAQTFAFVNFNKVCTSQYFLWYLIFLPIYLPGSILVRKPGLGFGVLAAWVGGQTIWLWHGYKLEMLGESTFVPGLWLSSLLFFVVNCWILGIIVADEGNDGQQLAAASAPGQGTDDSHMTQPQAQEKTLKDEGIDSNEDDEGSDVEEIVREQTIDEMVREEMRRRNGGTQQTNQMLRDYMAEIQTFIPDQ